MKPSPIICGLPAEISAEGRTLRSCQAWLKSSRMACWLTHPNVSGSWQLLREFSVSGTPCTGGVCPTHHWTNSWCFWSWHRRSFPTILLRYLLGFVHITQDVLTGLPLAICTGWNFLRLKCIHNPWRASWDGVLFLNLNWLSINEVYISRIEPDVGSLTYDQSRRCIFTHRALEIAGNPVLDPVVHQMVLVSSPNLPYPPVSTSTVETSISQQTCLSRTPEASLTKEASPQLAKRSLKANGRLANLELTSLVKRPQYDACVVCGRGWQATAKKSSKLIMSRNKVYVGSSAW